MSIKVSSINFKKSPLNFTATKNATVINNETTRKSVQLEIDNSVFSAKSETLVLEPAFYASSTIYFDENGLIQNSSGEYYTTSQGYGIAGYTDSEGVFTFSTVAVLAINTPELTAGVEGNITGTSNSSAVNVYYRLSTEEDWTGFQTGVTVTAGAWTATGTIADAGTYDFKVEDSLNPSAYAQVDDVTVASSESSDFFYTQQSSNWNTPLAILKNNKSDLSNDSTFLLPSTYHLALAVDADNVYLATSTAVKKYDKETGTLQATSSYSIQHIRGLAVDADFVYVVDVTAKKIVILNKSDLSIHDTISITTGTLSRVAVDNTYIYVTSSSSFCYIYKKSDYTFERSIGAFNSPTGVCVDESNIYIMASGDYTLHKIDKATYTSSDTYIPYSGLGDIGIDSEYLYMITEYFIRKYRISDMVVVATSARYESGIHYLAVEPNIWD